MTRIDEFYGIDIAFKEDFLASASGDLQKITGVQNVKDSLVRRTITEPGTLVHRPDYGVGLKKFVNALNSIDNKRELANRIKTQWEQEERVEEVLAVSIQAEDDTPEQIVISVRANLNGFGETEVRVISFQERVR